MVKSAEADIVRPTVAAEYPHRGLGEHIAGFDDGSGKRAGFAGAAFNDGILASGKQFVGGNAGSGGIVLVFKPFGTGGLDVGVGPVNGDESLDGVNEFRATLVNGESHAETVFGVIFEQRVRPCRTSALLVDGVRSGRIRTAPNGRAACGVGNIHTLAEELSDEFGIRSFATTCACAGELKQRLGELGTLRGVTRKRDLLLGNALDAVVEAGLIVDLSVERLHGDGLFLRRADVHAGTATKAVEDGDGHRKLEVFAALAEHLDGLDVCGSTGEFVGVERVRTDRGVRANERALVALNALGGIPFRDVDGNTTLFISGSTLRESTVSGVFECGNRQFVAVLCADRIENILDEVDEFLAIAFDRLVNNAALGVSPGGRDVDFDEVDDTGVNGALVHRNDLFTLLAVGVLNGILHVLDGVIKRDDAGKFEERGLKDHVDTSAEADLACEFEAVDGVEVDVVLGNVGKNVTGQVFFEFLHAPTAVEKEGATGLNILNDIVSVHIGRVVAGDEVGLGDEVGGFDRLVTETQVGNGDTAGLLGVVCEIRLSIEVGVVADDFDGVLVRTNGTVGAKSPELAGNNSFRRGIRAFAHVEGQTVKVVFDTDGEVSLGVLGLEVAVNGNDTTRSEVLAAQTVTAAGNLDIGKLGIFEGGDDIEEERFAEGARFLGAVENCDGLDGIRKCGKELVGTPRTIQTDLDKAEFFATGIQIVNGFFNGVAGRAHGNNDLFSIRRTVVVEEFVIGADSGVDLCHVGFDNFRKGVIVRIAGFTSLEEDIRVLGGATENRMFRIQRTLTEGLDGIHVDEGSKLFIIPNLNFLQLVRGAETVEEVQERNSAGDRGKVSNGGEVHNFLRVGGSEHGKAGLTACHDIGMVTEDGKSVGSKGSRRAVDNARKQLARDLIHVRDHQKKTLRSGEGGGQRTGGKGAVNCAGGAALGLHFDDVDSLTKDVFLAARRPLVGQFGHDRGRSDWENTGDVSVGICYMSRSGVTVHGFHFSCHVVCILLYNLSLDIQHIRPGSDIDPEHKDFITSWLICKQ